MLKRLLYSLATIAALAYVLGAPHKYGLHLVDRSRGLRRNGHQY
jgi:hypothetical protein